MRALSGCVCLPWLPQSHLYIRQGLFPLGDRVKQLFIFVNCFIPSPNGEKGGNHGANALRDHVDPCDPRGRRNLAGFRGSNRLSITYSQIEGVRPMPNPTSFIYDFACKVVAALPHLHHYDSFSLSLSHPARRQRQG